MVFLIIIGAAIWGSFLNVLGYRLILDLSLFPRSSCVHCQHILSPRDLVPLLSYIMLKGRCRYCLLPISILYPLIELTTICAALGLYYFVAPDYWIAYSILFSALIVTMRSDAESFLISRYATLCLVPVGILFSYLNYLPTSPINNSLGALIGYGFLWIIQKLFYYIRNQEGLGQGDLDCLCMIGSFTGILGCWATLMIASLIGSITGILYILYKKPTHQVIIPFGVFLALGAIITVLTDAEHTMWWLS